MSDMQDASGAVRRRRDARENREKILVAAREAFDVAGAGADVSMAEIARRAAIGQATLYRNFADRAALLEALYSDEIKAVAEAAATIEGATDIARLQNWLRRFSTYFTSKQAIASELLKHTGAESAVFRAGYARISAAAAPLVAAAHESRQLPNDISLEHVFALVGAIASTRGDATFKERLLELMLTGLASDPRSSVQS